LQNSETGGYLRVCTEGRNWFETDFPNWLKEPAMKFGQEYRGEEHGSYIIEGIETGREDNLIPTNDYQGAARLRVKTVEEMKINREDASRNAGVADKAKK